MRKTVSTIVLALALMGGGTPFVSSASADPLPTCSADEWPVVTLPPCNLPPEDANCFGYVYTYAAAINAEHNQYLDAYRHWQVAYERARRHMMKVREQRHTIRHLRAELRDLSASSARSVPVT